MNVGIGGVRRGVSEFLQVVYTKPLDICYDFAAVLKYDYPLLGKVSARHSEGPPFRSVAILRGSHPRSPTSSPIL